MTLGVPVATDKVNDDCGRTVLTGLYILISYVRKHGAMPFIYSLKAINNIFNLM